MNVSFKKDINGYWGVRIQTQDGYLFQNKKAFTLTTLDGFNIVTLIIWHQFSCKYTNPHNLTGGLDNVIVKVMSPLFRSNHDEI